MSFSDNIRRVTPYTPGEQPQRKVIKLNTNESPYPPSPQVVEAIRAIKASKLRLYPDPDCRELSTALRRNRSSWGLALTMCCPCVF